jgi:hypothetical protein
MFFLCNSIRDPSGFAVQGVVLRPPAFWDCRFESRRAHGCPSLANVVCCQVQDSASGWSPFQRSHAVCGVTNWVCECYLLSGTNFCVGLITRPEESYREWCVLSVIVKPRHRGDLGPLGELSIHERKSISECVLLLSNIFPSEQSNCSAFSISFITSVILRKWKTVIRHFLYCNWDCVWVYVLFV